MSWQAITPWASEIWIVNRPLRAMSFEFGARMTVVRLNDGGLWVHSPVRPTAATRSALDALGLVRWIIAPSMTHHLFAGPFHKAYPQARLLGVPGLEKKRSDLSFHSRLGEHSESDYEGDIDQLLLRGLRAEFAEAVFFHRMSRTLIVTDLIFNFSPARGLVEKSLFALNRWGQGPAPSRLFRAMVSDRRALRNSLDRILQWDPERIVMAHGRPIESGGKSVLESAFSWLS